VSTLVSRVTWKGTLGLGFLLLVGILFLVSGSRILAEDLPPGAEECSMCHETGKPAGKLEEDEPPAFWAAALLASPHRELECQSCHMDISDVPHDEELEKVDCGMCHDEQAEQFAESLHGQAIARQDKLAPSCTTCHGTHDVLRADDPRSPIAVINIPNLCGRCHHEGSPVSINHDIPQDHILANYSQSIHGEGILKKGLVVSAVCTSCHTAHFILPHDDPRSSINAKNVSKTCTRCHAQIEAVHRKVIRGELWEKQPHLIPACVDCHSPHRIRNVYYEMGMADRDCLYCHGRKDITDERGEPRPSLYVNEQEIRDSRHAKVACAQCHTGGTPSAVRACKTITTKVDCSICHNEVTEQYQVSAHGTLFAEGSPDAPGCNTCHGTHGTMSKRDPNSPT